MTITLKINETESIFWNQISCAFDEASGKSPKYLEFTSCVLSKFPKTIGSLNNLHFLLGSVLIYFFNK